jgi:predicted secreted protein
MFKGRRSRKIVLVTHCILNQNSKIDGCAHYPGAMMEVAELLMSSGCGIVQLPCPELMHLGWDRRVDRQSARTIESEDTRVGRLMSASAGRLYCRRIAEETAYQIQEYVKNSFEVCGMLGIDGSPTCGVETIWAEGQEEPGQGVLIQELVGACRKRSASLHIKGIRAAQPGEAIATTKAMLRSVPVR